MSGSPAVNDLQSIFQTYREQQFTGVVGLSAEPVASANSATGRTARPGLWNICFLLGRITWISSRTHGLRRWKRNLHLYSQALARRSDQRPDLYHEAWNYSAIYRLVRLKKIPSNHLANVIESVVTENLFDIHQGSTLQVNARQSMPQESAPQNQISKYCLAHTAIEQPITVPPPVIINDSRAWREASQEWADWCHAGLTSHSPDCGLTIVDFEALQLRTKGKIVQMIRACCNGNTSLRDLALQFRQPRLLLAKSILPYVNEELVSFTEIPNLVETVDHGFSSVLLSFQEPQPIKEKLEKPASSPKTVTRSEVAPEIARGKADCVETVQKEGPSVQTVIPTVVYIDDSPLDSRTMATIVEALGCRYNNISDPIQALPMLLEIKPDLIFLDLVMPVANGYEVCTQIRRISAFQKTPIIMMTGNDDIADRLRAKLAGASGFLGKPIRASKVDKVLKKCIQLPEMPIIVPPIIPPGLPTVASISPLTPSEKPPPNKKDSQRPTLDELELKYRKTQTVGTSKRRRVRDFLFS